MFLELLAMILPVLNKEKIQERQLKLLLPIICFLKNTASMEKIR
jgi:hypothetical protein